MPYISINCLHCGKSVKVMQQPSKAPILYCSRECSNYRYGTAKAKSAITPAELRRLYVDEGISIGTLAKRLGVGHRSVQAMLATHSIPQRTPSAEKLLETAQWTPEHREAIMAGCRIATRGMRQTDEHRKKIALTRQRTVHLSGDESEIMCAFESENLHPVPLYAVHRYNIDFAFPDELVAVEYNGGNWHNTPKKRVADKVKAEYLRQNGWTLLTFPRIAKPQANNAGNRKIEIVDIIRQVKAALHRTTHLPS